MNENEIISQEPDVVITPDVIQEEEQLVQDGIVVDCVKLNVRKAPAADAAIICTIPRETEVVISEEESTEEFYKVYTASGIEGFCMKQYISIIS